MSNYKTKLFSIVCGLIGGVISYIINLVVSYGLFGGEFGLLYLLSIIIMMIVIVVTMVVHNNHFFDTLLRAVIISISFWILFEIGRGCKLHLWLSSVGFDFDIGTLIVWALGLSTILTVLLIQGIICIIRFFKK